MLLTVDVQSGLVIGTELLEPAPSLEAMWGSVPMKVAEQLAAGGIVPEEVIVDSGLLFQLLQLIAEIAGFEVTQSPVLPNLHPAKESLLERFS